MSLIKIKFNPDLDHQMDAINAVAGVFEGQESFQSTFSVGSNALVNQQLDLYARKNDLGVGNALKLLPEELYENTRKVQLSNGLVQTESASQALPSLDFTIEMETGTGKTYVYLRSCFELNKRYGLTKFIIVVPSVAIKEGVYKSLQMTAEHFRQEYKNVQYDYFVYDSSRRDQTRNFATHDYIQIMLINIDAFSKSFVEPEKQNKANLIHRTDDRLNGMKPIEFIQATNPVVMIDEPQSVASTANRRQAIASLNPLCTFRFSATLTEKLNLLYKLDSIDAYERKLVKQIEVASMVVKDNHNQAYIRLLKVDNRKSPITAQLEMDAQTRSGKLQLRKKVTVRSGTDLFEASGGRSVYKGYVINDIYCEQGKEHIDFTSRDDIITLGNAIGEMDTDTFKRLQVSKTVQEHLNKELKFYKKLTAGADSSKHTRIIKEKGIKVLSLFFIDKVANYRSYDKNGIVGQGKFAYWFEEEFTAQLRKPRYRVLYPDAWHQDASGKSVINELALAALARSVHNGYFAQDRKKDVNGNPQFTESKLSAGGEGGKTAADESAYNLIMKDKEKLLSMDSKLRFIFSHSALKEGWDNPNIFQICTLNETSSVIKKRQEIGRGLRLAMDQSGERVPYGFEVNTLTVMANESYENFVTQLQKEIEQEEGIRFGTIEKHQFANMVVSKAHEVKIFLGARASEEIFNHLLAKDYIDSQGRIQDSLKAALAEHQVNLPGQYTEHANAIIAAINKVTKGLGIKKHEEKKTVQLREDNGKQVVLGDDFKALWDRIKYKTTYRVNFCVGKLVQKCIAEIRASVDVRGARVDYTKVRLDISGSGVDATMSENRTHAYQHRNDQLPDVVTYLESTTNLTRQTVIDILLGLNDRLEAFKNNPQRFIQLVSEVIRKQMRLAIVDGIRYHRIGDNSYYAQELFQKEELTGYLHNMVPASKSVYDYIICDSGVEFGFAEKLEQAAEVKLYARLPAWFRIDTPLGSYNPDWAVLIDKDDGMGDHLYFVVETKFSICPCDLRPSEQAKINCGTEHFKALKKDKQGNTINNPARFLAADHFDTLAQHFVKSR